MLIKFFWYTFHNIYVHQIILNTFKFIHCYTSIMSQKLGNKRKKTLINLQITDKELGNCHYSTYIRDKQKYQGFLYYV